MTELHRIVFTNIYFCNKNTITYDNLFLIMQTKKKINATNLEREDNYKTKGTSTIDLSTDKRLASQVNFIKALLFLKLDKELIKI